MVERPSDVRNGRSGTLLKKKNRGMQILETAVVH